MYLKFYSIDLVYKCFYLGVSFLVCLFLLFNAKVVLLYFFIEPIFNYFELFSWSVFFNHPLDLIYSLFLTCLFLGFLFIVPLVLVYCFVFFCSGLYYYEWCLFFIFIFVYLTSLLLVLFLFFYLLIPVSWVFFLQVVGSVSSSYLYYEYHLIVYQYIQITLYFCFLILLGFHIPGVFLFFYYSNITFFSVTKVRQSYYFLVLFLSTVCSPPDLFSQIFLVVFLSFIYEGIFYIYNILIIFFK